MFLNILLTTELKMKFNMKQVINLILNSLNLNIMSEKIKSFKHLN
jgi:hypothetical protein